MLRPYKKRKWDFYSFINDFSEKNKVSPVKETSLQDYQKTLKRRTP